MFLAPPWAEIYVNDVKRWQTFAEATALHGALRRTYQRLGFAVLELPKTPVAMRVAFMRAAGGLQAALGPRAPVADNSAYLCGSKW